MSHKQLPGPHDEGGGGKSLFTFQNFLALLGAILLIGSGVFTRTLFFVKDSASDLQPAFSAAGEKLVALNPGAPSFGVVINGKTYQWVGGMPSGEDWKKLTGLTYGNGSGDGSGSGNGNGTSPDSSGYDAVPPGTGEDPAALYAKYKTQFIGLVGGQPDIPDFTSLSAGNVKAARQTLALMRGTGIDLVTVTSWSDQLEEAVQSRFEDCFQRQDLGCVRDWNDLLSKVVSDPPGLSDWLKLVLSDNAKVNSIVNAASNTNAEDVLSNLLKDEYTKAFGDRITAGCNNLASGNITALEVQWCYASKTVHLWIVEPNNLSNFIPNEIGGNMGVLDTSDTLQIIYNGSIVDVPAAEAVKAIAGLSMDMSDTDYTFPANPALWDATAYPWTPGQPIP